MNTKNKKTLAFYAIGDDKTPSTRYRVLPLIRFFEQQGWDVDYYLLPQATGPWLIRNLTTLWQAFLRCFQLLQTSQYDLLVIQKGLTPWRSRWVLNFFLKGKQPYIYDYDDAIYVEPPILFPAYARSLQDTEAPVKLMKKAAIVVGGNKLLADYAKSQGCKSIVVPTAIDTEEYYPAPTLPANPVVIGWSGSVSTNFYVKALFPILQRLGEKHSFQFSIISDSMRDIELPADPRFEFKFIRWNPQTFVQDLQAMTIGLMPLIDDEWSRGKCGLKALQYMAAGLPVVLSPVGVNPEIVQHGKNGFLASSEDEWYQVLDLLLISPELRAEIGKAGRKTIEERYSVKVCAPQFIDIAEKVREENFYAKTNR